MFLTTRAKQQYFNSVRKENGKKTHITTCFLFASYIYSCKSLLVCTLNQRSYSSICTYEEEDTIDIWDQKKPYHSLEGFISIEKKNTFLEKEKCLELVTLGFAPQSRGHTCVTTLTSLSSSLLPIKTQSTTGRRKKESQSFMTR